MTKKYFKSITIFLLFFALLFTSCSGSVSSRGKYSKRSAEESIKYISKDSNGAWRPLGDNKDGGEVALENSKFKITFDRAGACVSSLILKEWNEKGSPLQMLLKNSDSDRAFLTYPSRDLSSPLVDVFDVTSSTSNSVTFEKKYSIYGQNATFKKTFRITNDYIVSLGIELIFDAPVEFPGDSKYFYTVGYGPKFGPSITSSSRGNNNERNYFLYRNGAKKVEKLNFAGDIFSYEGDYKWFELTGKYFALIMIPSSDKFDVAAIDNTRDMTSLFASRESESGAVISDTLNYYIGPQLKDKLKAFDFKEHNELSLDGLHLDKGMQKGGSFTWLQNLLRLIMSLFYKIIPNWGVAIVLLTLVVKAMLFPLYKKSMKSSQAMQKVAPELERLRNQYKDSPEMLNRATLELYRKHKISPASSLIPLLIQFPVLLAMYGLLNNRFELREAVFIPGWIDDLSSPDTVATIPFSIPLLGREIHVLPFIYFLSMIFSMMYTRSLSQGQNQSKASQRFMYIIMPIFFFFTLYNISSGLLVYWTLSNIVSIIQQMFMNKAMKREDNTSNKQNDNKSKGPLYNPNLPPKAKK